MNASVPNPASLHRQRGAASVGIAMLLMFILVAAVTAVLKISGSSAIDADINEKQVSSLFLAESGLQRAMGILSKDVGSGNLTPSSCTNIATSPAVSYPLGSRGGSFEYTSASCSDASCSTCNVQVVGKMANTSRKLNLAVNLWQADGVIGYGQNVSMQLANLWDVPAVGVFILAWRRQEGGGGGNATAAPCAACATQWNIESSSGTNSTGSMGITASLDPQPFSSLVTQTISAQRYFSEVGGRFASASSSDPVIVGSYADAGLPSGRGTTNNNQNSNPTYGTTTDGAQTSSWCTGNADTLVFGISAADTSYADYITSVTFNTNGNPSQNVPLNLLAHFPNTDGTTPQPPLPNNNINEFAEIRYAYNPAYQSVNSGAGATSYPKAVKGTIGATFNATFDKSDRTIMNVTSIANGRLSIGDNISTSDSKLDNTVTIAGVPSPGPTGNYTFSGNVYTGNSNNYSVTGYVTNSVKFIASATTGADLSAGSTNTPGVSIVSGPASGIYTISASMNLNGGAPSVITQGSSGSTINVPAGGSVPTAGTRVSVYSGTGRFLGNTTVSDSSAPTATTFTVSAAPDIPLVDAIICGGACAFFDHTTAETQFAVVKSGGTSPGTAQWAAGFTCLSGVDPTKIKKITVSSAVAQSWSEPVQ